MSLITRHMVWTAGNVSSFRGYDINEAGEVEMSDDEWEQRLTEDYGTVDVCGNTYDAGRVLREVSPADFDYGKSDEESRLTEDFQQALENEDESEIKFSEYEPWEINEDDPDEDAEEEDAE